MSPLPQFVLAFDHHCWFINHPIGLRNRKFFLLFVLWSTGLAALGLALSATDLLDEMPFSGKDEPLMMLAPLGLGGPMQVSSLGRRGEDVHAVVACLTTRLTLSVRARDSLSCVCRRPCSPWRYRTWRRRR